MFSDDFLQSDNLNYFSVEKAVFIESLGAVKNLEHTHLLSRQSAVQYTVLDRKSL